MNFENEIKKIIKRLEDNEKRIIALEEILRKNKGKPMKKFDINAEECFQKLSKAVGIDKGKIKYIIDFEESDFFILVNIKGDSAAEKQINATLCILTIYNYCYETKEIESEILKNKLENLGITSLGNLNINLKKFRNFIIPRGKPRSHNFSYKITIPGINRGLEIIKELYTSYKD